MSVTAVPLQPIQKGSVVRLWLGVAVVVAGSALLTWNGLRPLGQTKSGIAYRIVEPGTGESPTRDDFALVSYKGRLANGNLFDETPPGQPAPIDLTTMVPGFSESVTLLKKGGRIFVEIPPSLAYGAEARGDKIPANSTLIFEINLVEFMGRAQVMEMQRQQQMQQMLQQQMQGGGAPGGQPGEAPVLPAPQGPPGQP